MSAKIIPVSSGEKLIKMANMRVSYKGANRLREELIEDGKRIAEYVARIARHLGRKTIKAEDIRFAARHLRERK